MNTEPTPTDTSATESTASTVGTRPDNEGVRQARFVAPPGATTVLLVRHGESAAAHPDRPFPRKDGHGDPPLHPNGVHQAGRLATRLAHEHRAESPIDAIYVTTLQRTAQTAAPLAEAIGLTPRVVADLREVHLGTWEGGAFRTRIRSGDPIAARVIADERWDHIPGAEPLEEFDRRVRRGLSEIVAAHPDQRVVVVVHGGVIGHLLHLATGSTRFAFAWADNTSISELVVWQQHQRVVRFNDRSHLID